MDPVDAIVGEEVLGWVAERHQCQAGSKVPGGIDGAARLSPDAIGDAQDRSANCDGNGSPRQSRIGKGKDGANKDGCAQEFVVPGSPRTQAWLGYRDEVARRGVWAKDSAATGRFETIDGFRIVGLQEGAGSGDEYELRS